MNLKTKKCEACVKEFIPNSNSHKFCDCSNDYKRWKKKNTCRYFYSILTSRCNFGAYKKRGIRLYLSYEQFKQLWEKYSADKMKQPSIDRINPLEDYTVDNTRIIELAENKRGGKLLARTKICKLDLEGNLLESILGVNEAAKRIGIHHNAITLVLRGKQKTAGGYKWDYYENYLQEQLNNKNKRIKEFKKIYYDLADCIAKESYSPKHLQFLARRTRKEKDRLQQENKELKETLNRYSVRKELYQKSIKALRQENKKLKQELKEYKEQQFLE
jgi:hypothetical protein